MKPSLQLRLSQQLTLTPQLQQAIRLLQLSTQDIHQEVAQMLDENPMLELADESVPQSYPLDAGRRETQLTPSTEENSSREEHTDAAEWDESSAYSSAPRHDEDDDYVAERAADGNTLREHLHEVLGIGTLNTRDCHLVGLLIDALDENGYLAQDLSELCEMIPPELDVSLDDLETALVQLQHLDQAGIGARTLKECLALQLKALPEDTPHRQLALRLINDHLEILAAHDFVRIKRALHCTDDELRAAQFLITGLNPKPGSEYDRSVADYVIPDVIVEKSNGRWQARLNPDAMPKLRVNQLYAGILQQRDASNGGQLGTQLQEAKWLIKNLQQRFDTILRVAQAIAERQGNFLEHGEIGMRPLILREIAEKLDLHESTVSRSTTQKFMLTPRGIYEFKYFFGSGLATDSGGTCSSTAIRALIKQLVGEEDRRKPLTDSRMSEILAQQGIVVARRTIAKYREALSILPVNLRKSL